MRSKIINNLGYLGLLVLFAGVVNYSLNKEWDLVTRIAIYAGLGLLLVYVLANIPRLAAFFGTRGGRRGGMAGATLLLVLGILVLANFLNYRHHKRTDLSEGGLYALSDQTRQVAGALKEDVKILGFYEQPGEARAFQDVMKEYRYLTDRISFEVVDPQQEPSRVAQYQVERDGQIVVAAANSNQKIDNVQEATITNALIKVTRSEQKTVYFLTGHNERGIDDSEDNGYSAAKAAIEKQNYQVKGYDLAVEGKLPEDASLLIAAGPQNNFFPNEIELLESYFSQGGKFLLMVDPQTGFQMNDFLRNYGIEYDDDVIVDVSGLGRLLGLGPAVPLVNSYRKHPVTEKLSVTSFYPLARSVRAVKSSLGYESSILFSSSGRSWGETEMVEGREIGFDEGKDFEGPLPIAVVSTISEASSENGSPESADQESPEKGKRETRILALGDADFMANRYQQVGGGNADIFLNMVSWLAQDEDLIAVRPKDPTSRRVNLTARDAGVLFWGTVVLLPLATIILGVGVWYRRR